MSWIALSLVHDGSNCGRLRKNQGNVICTAFRDLRGTEKMGWGFELVSLLAFVSALSLLLESAHTHSKITLRDPPFLEKFIVYEILCSL